MNEIDILFETPMPNKSIEIGDIFKNHIKIEPKVMAVETLFNNTRRFDKTNYKPPYQRNYVWDDEKASYFIESILLGTEIPPLIFFNSGEVIEVIDGRQRYETIYRFVNNKFKLKKSGLLILRDLANKYFDDLKELKDTIWDTKLRIIEFSFHSKPETQYDIEDIVKKEIFKRYNTGITPLTPIEIDKAKYIDDDLNSFIKKTLRADQRLYDYIVKCFFFENENIETILKKIRQLLVQHNIPISYYAIQKQSVINKFYELLSDSINDEEEIKRIFYEFIKKINFIHKVKGQLDKKVTTNRLVFECLFWALSVAGNENIPFDAIENLTFEKELCAFLVDNIERYKTERNSFSEQIFDRYGTTARFFQEKLNVSFNDYLKNHEDFKKLNRTINKEKTSTDTLQKFESLRLNKPDASSNSIDDVCRQMIRQRFMIRPIYQRNEVINKNKSSAIIESILLGIKLPPIFVFKRSDGLSEVIDGQQRLLSILGFLGKEYLDENKNLTKSEKDKFSLNLKNSILRNFDRRKFTSLPKVMQEKILDYDLWIIEIDQKTNPDFDPIDLFIRLNYKPYPIKENTFEMWNAYVDRHIIESIKNTYNANKAWFYLRKNNKRMDNEGLILSLVYLQFKLSNIIPTFKNISTFLESYKIGEKISIRIRSKNDITKTLDAPENLGSFLNSCKKFEDIFLVKLKELIDLDDTSTEKSINERLNNLLNAFSDNAKRTNQNFYALWLMLSNISVDSIRSKKAIIRKEINSLFKIINSAKSINQFENSLTSFWGKYGSNE